MNSIANVKNIKKNNVYLLRYSYRDFTSHYKYRINVIKFTYFLMHFKIMLQVKLDSTNSAIEFHPIRQAITVN